jgi:hypothetical protein
VQWAMLGGALTAGRAQSFFDFYANDLNWTSIAGSDHKTQLFAYTASFGSGFSATLSVEDPTVTKTGLWAADSAWYRNYGVGPLDPINGGGPPYSASPYYYAGNIAYGGTRVPDLVANLRADQGWGSVQLSGALHESRWSAFGSQLDFTIADGSSTYSNSVLGLTEAYADTKWGYALQAGVKINLPMLGQGDILYLQAAYADGATAYLGVNNIPISLGYSLGTVGDQWIFPGYEVTNGGQNWQGSGSFTQKSVTGYALTAAALHYWTPTIRQALFGSYLHLDNPTSSFYGVINYTDPASNAPAPTGWYNYGPNDTKVWQIGTNLIWSPVAGLDIGAEVGYINVDNGRQPYAYYSDSVAGVSGFTTKSSADRYYGRFRIQREF